MPSLLQPSIEALRAMAERNATLNLSIGSIGENITASAYQVVCAWPVSGGYGPGSRILFYILVASSVFYRRAAWISKPFLAAALLLPAVAALHAITLTILHQDGTIDMDIYGIFQLCSIGILIAPLSIKMSQSHFTHRAYNGIAFLWTALLLAGLLSLTIEFYRSEPADCRLDNHGNSISPDWGSFPYGEASCSLPCPPDNELVYTLRLSSADRTHIVPAPQMLPFHLVALLAAACCIPAVLSLVYSGTQIFHARQQGVFGHVRSFMNDMDKRINLPSLYGSSPYRNYTIRIFIDLIEVYLAGIFTFIILILGEMNLWSPQVKFDTEPLSSVGQWGPLVGGVLATLGAIYIVMTGSRPLEEVTAKPSSRHSHSIWFPIDEESTEAEEKFYDYCQDRPNAWFKMPAWKGARKNIFKGISRHFASPGAATLCSQTEKDERDNIYDSLNTVAACNWRRDLSATFGSSMHTPYDVSGLGSLEPITIRSPSRTQPPTETLFSPQPHLADPSRHRLASLWVAQTDFNSENVPRTCLLKQAGSLPLSTESTRTSAEWDRTERADLTEVRLSNAHPGSSHDISVMNISSHENVCSGRPSFSDESLTTDADSVESSLVSDEPPYMDDGHPLLCSKPILLAAIMTEFDSRTSRTHAPGGNAGTRATNTPGAWGTGGQATGRSKRERQSDSNENAERRDSDEYDGGDPKRMRGNDLLPGTRRPRLACPFYKKDPLRYRTCHGKVISTIAHLKQHLKRNHQLPVYCPICKAAFDNETVRDQHSESQSCELRTDVVHDGVTAHQRRLLARRASTALDEAGQWFEVFDILFPGFQPRPRSPYINAELSAEMERFQDFLPLRGPTIIVETMRSRGLRVSGGEGSSEEEDVATFMQIVLPDALQIIADRWNESQLVDPSESHVSYPSSNSLSSGPTISQSDTQGGATNAQPTPPHRSTIPYHLAPTTATTAASGSGTLGARGMDLDQRTIGVEPGAGVDGHLPPVHLGPDFSTGMYVDDLQQILLPSMSPSIPGMSDTTSYPSRIETETENQEDLYEFIEENWS
ncbi:hypothetical protein BX600DRAFT_548767 [Xylariales sp. PMI_506]|nr:hypothetical protein BX600DRAFT_548767 [Xylariales sp. PMI_506]